MKKRGSRAITTFWPVSKKFSSDEAKNSSGQMVTVDLTKPSEPESTTPGPSTTVIIPPTIITCDQQRPCSKSTQTDNDWIADLIKQKIGALPRRHQACQTDQYRATAHASRIKNSKRGDSRECLLNKEKLVYDDSERSEDESTNSSDVNFINDDSPEEDTNHRSLFRSILEDGDKLLVDCHVDNESGREHMVQRWGFRKNFHDPLKFSQNLRKDTKKIRIFSYLFVSLRDTKKIRKDTKKIRIFSYLFVSLMDTKKIRKDTKKIRIFSYPLKIRNFSQNLRKTKPREKS